MSPAVCLAVLLGAAAPNAFVVEEQPIRLDHGFNAVHEALENAVAQPPTQWLSHTGHKIPFLSQPTSHETAFLVRGQSPPYDPAAPITNPNLAQSMTLPPSPSGPWFPTQGGGGVWPGTPLLNPNGMVGGGQPNATMMGVNGPRPFRFGWQSSFDVGYLPGEATNPANGTRDFGTGMAGDPVATRGLGRMGIFEFNSEIRYTAPTWMQHVFSIAPQFNMRSWDGPGTGARTIDPVPAAAGNENPTGAPLNGFSTLPGSVYRFGLDLRLTTPTWGPYTMEFGFNPSINSDFQSGLESFAWSFDGHGALFHRVSPQYLIVLGAMFWDRVDDRVLPYAGIVFTPNQYFELRALFPKAEMSFFIGAPWGVPQWLYLAGEYHIEAYQVDVHAIGDPAIRENRVQIEDWRLLLGVRSETGGMTSFLEAGWVFGRDVEFLKKATPGFDISSGFIARFGIRY